MKTTARAICTHPGCNETAFWEFDTRKEAAEHYKYRAKWKCVRHTNPDTVLSATNRERVIVLTVTPSDSLNPKKHRFWHDGVRLASAFSFSAAHKAYATDFPEGTKLVITARIELPESSRESEAGSVLKPHEVMTPPGKPKDQLPKISVTSILSGEKKEKSF